MKKSAFTCISDSITIIFAELTIILFQRSHISLSLLLPLFVLVILSWQSIYTPISSQADEIGTEQIEVEMENDELEEFEIDIIAGKAASWAIDFSEGFAVNCIEYSVSLAVPDSPPELR